MARMFITMVLAAGPTSPGGAPATDNTLAWIVGTTLGVLFIAMLIWGRIQWNREVQRAKKSRWATWLDDPNATSGDEEGNSGWSD